MKLGMGNIKPVAMSKTEPETNRMKEWALGLMRLGSMLRISLI